MIIDLSRVDKTKWHRWYAWHPVVTNGGKLVWFDYVDRRVEVTSWDSYWEYRLP